MWHVKIQRDGKEERKSRRRKMRREKSWREFSSQNSHRMEVFISFSNVESSCFPQPRVFACVKLGMLVEKIRLYSHFPCLWWCIGTYLCSHLARRRRIFHVMMVKVSSFPFRSVVSISWSEIVQLIRVCSLYQVICSDTAKIFVWKKKNTIEKKFSLKCSSL